GQDLRRHRRRQEEARAAIEPGLDVDIIDIQVPWLEPAHDAESRLSLKPAQVIVATDGHCRVAAVHNAVDLPAISHRGLAVDTGVLVELIAIALFELFEIAHAAP